MLDFDKDTTLLRRLLGASAQRAEVLSANLANQNTPGYVRRYVRFEELLAGTLAAGRDAGGVEPEVVEDRVSPAGPDGNNVQLEAELGAIRRNRLLGETYMTLLEGHFALLRTAMEQR